MKKLLNAVRDLFADKEARAELAALKDEVLRLRAELAGLDRAVTSSKPMDEDRVRSICADMCENGELACPDDIPQYVRDEMAEYEIDEDRVREICDDWQYDEGIPDEDRVNELIREFCEENNIREFSMDEDELHDAIRAFCEGEEFVDEESCRGIVRDEMNRALTDGSLGEDIPARLARIEGDICKAEAKVRVLLSALRCVNEVTE